MTLFRLWVAATAAIVYGETQSYAETTLERSAIELYADLDDDDADGVADRDRSEEHTSELQSPS